MGSYNCKYCTAADLADLENMQYDPGSSGEPELEFSNGNSWKLPYLALHYVERHKWLPPKKFINDVMSVPFLGGRYVQSKGVGPERVGYLEGDFPTGQVPVGFLEKLATLIELSKNGNMA